MAKPADPDGAMPQTDGTVETRIQEVKNTNKTDEKNTEDETTEKEKEDTTDAKGDAGQEANGPPSNENHNNVVEAVAGAVAAVAAGNNSNRKVPEGGKEEKGKGTERNVDTEKAKVKDNNASATIAVLGAEKVPENEKVDTPNEQLKMKAEQNVSHQRSTMKPVEDDLTEIPGASRDELDQPLLSLIPTDPLLIKQQELIEASSPSTELEGALYDTLKRREAHIERLTNEVTKLRAFISKRKQTYKRKRKDEGAPTRALSAYNIFVQDRFSRLAKENEQALKSADSDAQLKRVPPASLVASTGNEWKELSAEQKSHYEERAREDRKRYEEQMAKYQPPDKQTNRKRNKTGYNMFFSAHVLRLKQSETGVPSERGSVARLVGNAWKQLSNEDKQYYEREADKQNGMNPIDANEEEEEEIDNKRNPHIGPYEHHYMHGAEMHLHMGAPIHNMHQPPHPSQHDPRQHYAPYPPIHYAQPYPGYHEQAAQGRAYHQGRAHPYHQGYPHPPPRHYHENPGMGM